MNKRYKQNSTFKFGTSIDFNACVGKNGLNDISIYEDGYKEAVLILIEKTKEDRGLVDPLIYPMIFSARHYIELFLKRTVAEIGVIAKKKNPGFTLRDCFKTHNLKTLWEYAKEIAVVDKRFLERISFLDQYVSDYFEIDLTGQTFRYPYNQDAQHHLDEFAHINILIFERRYREITKIIEQIRGLLDLLLMEYEQGTFIDDISRWEIELISKDLPPRNQWINKEFDQIKKTIKEKYQISSNKLSKIIKLIENHKEFSANIEIVIPVKEINTNHYMFFKNSYNSFHQDDNDGKDFYSQKESVCSEICSQIPPEGIAALVAFREISYNHLYSEQYEPLIEKYSKNDPIELVFDYLLDSQRVIEWIENGMRKCGQTHFINR